MKHLFNGHSDYQTQVYTDSSIGKDIWIIRFNKKKSNGLKTVDGLKRGGWSEYRIDFTQIDFLSAVLLSKLKEVFKTLAMKNVPETVDIYRRNCFKALSFMAAQNLISASDEALSSEALLGAWDKLSERQRESLRAINNYDAVGFYERDIAPRIPVANADHYGKRYRAIVSPTEGTLTRQEVVRMLIGARNALESGKIDIKDAVMLFLVYECGQRSSVYSQLAWKDFYCIETSEEVRWYVDLPARKGAVETIAKRLSNTTATLLKGYYQLFENHARSMGVTGELSNYPIFVRSGLGGDLFMSTEDHQYHWDSSISMERFIQRLNEILLKLQIQARDGKPLRFNSNRARHTGATFRIREGASVNEVQRFLQHRTPDVANVYVDIASTEIADMIDNAFEHIFANARMLAKKAKPSPMQINPAKVVTFFNPHTNEVEVGGQCGFERRCQDAPFSCVTGCDKFNPFLDAPFDVLLETLKQEFKDYLESSTSSSLVSEYYEMIASLEQFIQQLKNMGAIEGEPHAS